MASALDDTGYTVPGYAVRGLPPEDDVALARAGMAAQDPRTSSGPVEALPTTSFSSLPYKSGVSSSGNAPSGDTSKGGFPAEAPPPTQPQTLEDMLRNQAPPQRFVPSSGAVPPSGPSTAPSPPPLNENQYQFANAADFKGARGAPTTALDDQGLPNVTPTVKMPAGRVELLEKTNPRLLQILDTAAQDTGVSTSALINLAWVNNGFRSTDGSMNVSPTEARQLDPDRHFNPLDPVDQAYLGAVKYKGLSNIYGPSTASSYVAFKFGPETVNAMARMSEDDRRKHYPEVYQYLNQISPEGQVSPSAGRGAQRQVRSPLDTPIATPPAGAPAAAPAALAPPSRPIDTEQFPTPIPPSPVSPEASKAPGPVAGQASTATAGTLPTPPPTAALAPPVPVPNVTPTGGSRPGHAAAIPPPAPTGGGGIVPPAAAAVPPPAPAAEAPALSPGSVAARAALTPKVPYAGPTAGSDTTGSASRGSGMPTVDVGADQTNRAGPMVAPPTTEPPAALPGTTPPAAPAGRSVSADPKGWIAVGDSIAHGYQTSGGVGGTGIALAPNDITADAAGGRSPETVLNSIKAHIAKDPNYYRDKNIILSSGTSNNPAQVAFVDQQIKQLKAAGAANIQLVGVGTVRGREQGMTQDINLNPYNGALSAYAKTNGVQFGGPITGAIVHPGKEFYTGAGAPRAVAATATPPAGGAPAALAPPTTATPDTKAPAIVGTGQPAPAPGGAPAAGAPAALPGVGATPATPAAAAGGDQASADQLNQAELRRIQGVPSVPPAPATVPTAPPPGAPPAAVQAGATAYEPTGAGSPARTAPGGHMITGPGNMTTQGFTAAASQGGPQGAMNYMVNNAPRGMSVNNQWAHISHLYETAMILKGDFAGAAHARDYVFQLQYTGSNQALMQAYKALALGDAQGAGQLIALSHAFVQDGSTVATKVGPIDPQTGKPSLWAQRFNDATQQPVGSPFKITLQGIAGMLNTTLDPQKFLSTRLEEQKAMAKIAHDNDMVAARIYNTNKVAEMAHEGHVMTAGTAAAAQENANVRTAMTTGQSAANSEAQIQARREIADQVTARLFKLQQLKIAGLDDKFVKSLDTETTGISDPNGVGFAWGDLDPKEIPDAAGLYYGLRSSSKGTISSAQATQYVKGMLIPDPNTGKVPFTTRPVLRNGVQETAILGPTDKVNPIAYLPQSVMQHLGSPKLAVPAAAAPEGSPQLRPVSPQTQPAAAPP